MTDSQLTALKELTSEGYAVIVWTPEELRNAKPTHVEDRLIELGHQIIEDLQ